MDSKILHYTLLSLFSVFVFIFPTAIASSSSNAATNKNFVLVLDAGHGGHDSGAIGLQGKEKDITLSVTLLVGKIISAQHPNVTIVYTRDKDIFVDLWQRAEISNKLKADLFISIHANASHNSTARGSEIYVFGISKTQENLDAAKRENSVIYMENRYEEKYEGFDPKASESYIVFKFLQNKFLEQSLEFASMVQNELKSCVPWADRGIKQAEYLVLRKASMPRILIELDFITNSDAEQFLLSETGQKQLAQAISNAFTSYKNSHNSKIRILWGGSNSQNQDTVKNNKEEYVHTLPDTTGNEMIIDTTVTSKLYKVQILATVFPLEKNNKEFKGYSVDSYKENNVYKYTYGSSPFLNEISNIRKSILNDFKDAFIVCFENDKRVQLKK